MQGPMSVLNVLTIPPGATSTQQRLVIDGVRGAIFVYTNGGPLGALVGSWASKAGTDPYGNSYPAGFETTAGNSTIEGNNFILNANGLFIYNQSASGPTVITFSAGSGNWLAPAGVTTVQAEVTAPGGGGSNGLELHQGSGGGGEYAQEPALAVTPGNLYAYNTGTPGSGGASSNSANNPGTAGTNATMAGNAVTVTAHGGGAGTTSAGAGGTGSTNTIHFNGGAGNTIGASGDGGAGGGSSASSAGAGTKGKNNGGTNTGGAGGTAPLGGGDGGQGGNGVPGTAGVNGAAPGGGGGSGGITPVPLFGAAGGNGGSGLIKLTYTPTGSNLALISSICGIATTDPQLGINCPIGVTDYNPTTQTVQANLGGGNLSFIDTVNATQAPGLIGLASIAATNDSLELTSPSNSPTDVQPSLALQRQATGNPGIMQLLNGIFNMDFLSPTTPTPSAGINFVFDTGHNFWMIGDNVGGNNHILFFNFDITLRSAIVPSAPTVGVRLTADSSNNLVITPAGAALVKLVTSGLWIQDNTSPAAPAAGSIFYVDSSHNLHIIPSVANKVVLDNSNMTFLAGPALSVPSTGVMIRTDGNSLRMGYCNTSGASGAMNFPGCAEASFPNNTITNATLGNLSSMTILANDAEIGASYEVEVDGNWTEATGTAVSFRFTGGLSSVSSATT